MWNSNNGYFHTVFIPFKSEGLESRNGRNNWRSPKTSPILCRKPLSPESSPPPLPLRKAAIMFRHPMNLFRSNSTTTEGNSSSLSTTKPQRFYSNMIFSELAGPEIAYDALRKLKANLLSNPSMVKSGIQKSSLNSTNTVQSLDFSADASKPEVSLRYSELPRISDEHNYENILIEGNFLKAKDRETQQSASSLKTATSMSPLPSNSSSRTTSRASSPFPTLSSSSSSIANSTSRCLVSSNPYPPMHALPSPSRISANEIKINFHKSSSNDPRSRVNDKFRNNLKNNKNVPYENLNMDYIEKLTSEGYAHDAVIRALGITKNDAQMACDILHTFGTKSTAGTT